MLKPYGAPTKPTGPKPGQVFGLRGSDVGYVRVGESYTIRRVIPKVRGKAARRLDKQQRREAREAAARAARVAFLRELEEDRLEEEQEGGL